MYLNVNGYYEACMMGYYDACVIGYFGIWVILACPNFIRGCHVFWRLQVTIENDDVSTKLIIIFIIEIGIWVILACPNFIRGCHVFWQL